MFTIYPESADLIVLRLTGFWGESQMIAFADAMRATLSRIRPGAPFDVLADLTDYPVQSAAIVAAQEKVIYGIQAHGLRRGATVLASSLLRMQIERVSAVEHMRYFADMASARAWLATPFAP